MKQRRGFAITFNWIFSIIVGIIILSFFVYFAIQNTDLFGNLTAKQVAWELDNVFSGFQTTAVETTLSFNKPIKLEFKCDEGREYIFINKKGSHILKDKIIFAPSKVEDNEFLLWTKEWKVPYKVSNFIFLTSSDDKYNLKGDSLNLDFPEDSDMGKEVEFRKTPCNSNEVTGKNVIISYQEDDEEYYGTICTSNNKYGFYGEAMIYAAIFSDEFDCLYNLMMKKLGLVSKLYDQKAALLYSDFAYSGADLRTILTTRNRIKPDFKNDVNFIKNDNENRFSQNKALLY